MKSGSEEYISLNNGRFPLYTYDTVIVGTGAAGLNCALHLYDFGTTDICIVTEGIHRGTSRNSGSDKQTYYKLSLGGKEKDSVHSMASTLFNGGSMDGDIALCEAGLSWQEFAHLIQIGVPFPHNRWGEYTGYQTDHDSTQRASSAGPLTSQMMCQCLEQEILKRDITIYNKTRVVKILTQEDENSKKICGTACISSEEGTSDLCFFRCRNLVYAAGGPAGIYLNSVYPLSQGGATGTALIAGAHGKNLTESQYGIASLKFRWNLSGTYQQVLPSYVSADQNGDNEKEFLQDYFPDTGSMLNAQFLKGYQWPFTPARIMDHGSSLVDLAVYHESVVKGRKVFLDFRKNPGSGDLDFALLSKEAYSYLEKSGVLSGSPVERLIKMNEPAYELYNSHGIDLEKEMLEIGVCAQHNNGGLSADIWWESNIKGFFPIGEVNGTHGIVRPGGSALNSGQVGGYRAAEYIFHSNSSNPKEHIPVADFTELTQSVHALFSAASADTVSSIDPNKEILELRERMDRTGAVIRDADEVDQAVKQARKQYARLIQAEINREDLMKYLILIDHSITQIVYLESIKEYIAKKGISRGSYLIIDEQGHIPAQGLEQYAFRTGDDPLKNMICITEVSDSLEISFTWREVNPIPDQEQWFETVWKEYREGGIFK